MSVLEWIDDGSTATQYRGVEATVPIGNDAYLTISVDPDVTALVPAALAALPEVRAVVIAADRLPELRGRFERIIAVAQAENPPPGHIQLADRLLDAVVAWQGEVQP